MPYHYTPGGLPAPVAGDPKGIPNLPRMDFEFYRFRFHFQAREALDFPPGGAGNLVRGAFGALLRKIAPTELYTRLFEPGKGGGHAPSGLAEWPRPFVFRTAHLDGTSVPAGGIFFIDAHVFEIRQPVLRYFRDVFAEWAAGGIGPGRSRAELLRATALGLEDETIDSENTTNAMCSIPLTGGNTPVDSVLLRFVTPTELKTAGEVAERPEFAILFARLRDRISTLRTLYGAGALSIDFRGLGERAAAVRMGRSELTWEYAERRSRRTGRVHPLGGFTGETEYHGNLAEFVPWLGAARWIGIGRQTVWGKGEVRVIEARASDRPNV